MTVQLLIKSMNYLGELIDLLLLNNEGSKMLVFKFISLMNLFNK